MARTVCPVVILMLLLPLLAIAAEADVAARVNGAPITFTEVNEEVDRLVPEVSYHGRLPANIRDEYREKALETLIRRELIYQEALAKNMKPDRKKVKDRMTAIQDRFKSKKEFKKALANAGISEDALRARIEKQVLVEDLTKTAVDEKAKMSTEMLKEYYVKNAESFREPEKVKMRIMTFKGKEKADDALRRIKAGEDFGTVAAKMSEDDYRIKGGELGFVHRGRLLPEIEDAAFSMEPGSVRGLLQSENRWFIVQVQEKMPSSQISFEDAQPKLKRELESKKASAVMEEWVASLRSGAKIEILGNASAEN